MTVLGWSYGVAVAWAIGLVIVRRLAPPEGFALARASLGLCVGLIATGVLRYGLQVLGTTAPGTVIAADHLLLLGAGWSLRSAPAGEPPRDERTDPGTRQGALFRSLAWVLMAIAVLLAVRTTAAQIEANPFGHWDAIAIWNVKAHLLFSGGARWLDTLHATEWPDYPLLVPLTVARLAAYAGSWSEGAAIASSLMFFAATCGLLAGSLSREIGPCPALVALTLFLSPKPVRLLAGAACADIPLGALCLATSMCLWRGLRNRARGNGYPMLAGICAGGALFTKNDATVLVVLVASAFLVADWLSKRPRGHASGGAFPMGLACVLGASPALMATIHLKASVTSTSWVFAGRDVFDVLQQAVDPERFRQAWSVLPIFIRDYVHPTSALLLAIAALCAPRSRGSAFWVPWSLLTGILVAQVGAYFLAYVTSPYDVAWHVTTSASRLGLHVWPSAVMTAFLAIFADATTRCGAVAPRACSPPPSTAPSTPRTEERPC